MHNDPSLSLVYLLHSDLSLELDTFLPTLRASDAGARVGRSLNLTLWPRITRPRPARLPARALASVRALSRARARSPVPRPAATAQQPSRKA